MRIKELKIGNSVFSDIDTAEIDESGTLVYPKLQNIEYLKEIAIDTLNWKIGRVVLDNAGGKQVDLSASNSKSIVAKAKILNKIVEQIGLDLSGFLTPLEMESFNLEIQLAENGYSDSEKLKNTLTAVVGSISKYTERMQRVVNADNIEEIINILNED